MMIKDYFKNKSGSMSVEFALIGPVLCFLMMGLIDAGEALARYRVVTQITESVVNVAKSLSVAATKDSRANLSVPNIAIVKRGIDLIAATSSLSDIKVSVYTVSKSANSGELYTDNFLISGSSLTAGDYNVDNLSGGESVVICEAEYTQPVFFDVFKKPFNLNARYMK